MMNLGVLETSREAILAEASTALKRSHQRHYEQAGEAERTARLARLFDTVVLCLEGRTLLPVVERSEEIARERFEAGYDIGEVQTAFNVLEEALWRYVVAGVERSELVEAIALLTTVLGAGKDSLARTYVSLAAHEHVPSLDMTALFGGEVGVA